MKQIEFVIFGKPTGKGRPRATVRGRFASVYTDEKTRAAEGSVLAQALKYKPVSPLLGPVTVTIAIGCPIPTSWAKCKKRDASLDIIKPTSKPDVDNVAKLLIDALNGVFYADDAQIYNLSVSKYFDIVPKTRLVIEYDETYQGGQS